MRAPHAQPSAGLGPLPSQRWPWTETPRRSPPHRCTSRAHPHRGTCRLSLEPSPLLKPARPRIIPRPGAAFRAVGHEGGDEGQARQGRAPGAAVKDAMLQCPECTEDARTCFRLADLGPLARWLSCRRWHSTGDRLSHSQRVDAWSPPARSSVSLAGRSRAGAFVLPTRWLGAALWRLSSARRRAMDITGHAAAPAAAKGATARRRAK